MDTEARRNLRGAIYRRDGAAILVALHDVDLGRYLQFAGDGLLIALEQGIDGAVETAERCVPLLQERFWDGDGELVTELEAAMGERPPSELKPVSVALEDLAEVLDSGDYDGGALDLAT